MLGLRRSASTNRTREPFCASTIDVLMAVVLFPSWGSALVMRMIFGGDPSELSSKEVRKARYDSAICDWGRVCVTSSTASLEAATARRLLATSASVLEPIGIMPSDGRA